MTNPTQLVREKCIQIFALAARLYNVDLYKASISFTLKGRCAGIASARHTNFGGPLQLALRFNHDMVTRGDPDVLDDMINDTVPHEIAHLVCFTKPALGKNHDGGWAQVCVALGGSGNRTHDNEVVYGKGRTFEYTTDRGHKVRLNDRRHEYIQSGGVLTYRRGLGAVTKMCAYSLVGVRGRSLTPTAVKVVAPNSAAIVAQNIKEMTGGTPNVTTSIIRERVYRKATESDMNMCRRIVLSGERYKKTDAEIIEALDMVLDNVEHATEVLARLRA